MHGREVDHDAAFAHRVTGEAVAAAAHRDQQIVARGKLHRADHVGGAGAARDQRRMTVECAVPDAPRNVVTLAGACEHGSALVGAEIIDVRGLENDGAAGARDRGHVGGFRRARESRMRQAGRGHERHGTGKEVSSSHVAAWQLKIVANAGVTLPREISVTLRQSRTNSGTATYYRRRG